MPQSESFDFHSVDVRYPVEGLKLSAGGRAEAEVLFGFDVYGNVHVDFTDVGSGIVDGAPLAGGPIRPTDIYDVSA